MSKKTNDLIKFEDDARKELLAGSKLIYDAVSKTLGAKGRNVVIKRGFDEEPFITKDGVTVARHIDSTDLMQKGAIQIIRRAAERTNEEAGDGTSTSVAIAYTLLEESIKVLNKKWYKKRVNSILFKKGIDIALEAVLENLTLMAKMDFKTFDVAAISANGDLEIAKLISEAFNMVGKEGIVGYEASGSTDSYIVRDEGLKMESGYATDFFITDMEKRTATYKESLVLLIDAEIEKMNDIIYYAMAAEKEGLPLIVIAHKFGQEVLNSFSKSKVEKGFRTILVEAPFYGEKRSQVLQDIGKMTNASVLSERMGTLTRLGTHGSNNERRAESAKKHIGRINKIVSSKEETSIYYNINKEYIQELKDSYTETKDEFTRERIAMLTGGVAVINVGGNSETEVKERLDRVEDAVNATRASLNNGVVAGGGTALLVARKAILKLKFNSYDEKKGASTLYKVLASPAKKILANAELPYKKYGSYPNWIDVSDNNTGNFFELGIVDPVNVTVAAVKNAVSVASTLSTAGAYVLIVR